MLSKDEVRRLEDALAERIETAAELLAECWEIQAAGNGGLAELMCANLQRGAYKAVMDLITARATARRQVGGARPRYLS